MLDSKFRSLEEKIQKHIDNRILLLETQLQKMEVRLQEMKNESQEKKKSPQEGKVDNIENINPRNKIKELEEKINNNFSLIELDNDCDKRALNLIIFGIKEKKDEDTLTIVKKELKK